MYSVSEEISSLKAQEDQLHQSLDNLRGQRSKAKEHKQQGKELALLIRKRQNLESLERFEIGMPVNRADSRSLGKVTEIMITPGGLGKIWVSWDGRVQIPEQPHLLKPDTEAIAQIIAVGDRIIIGNSHAASGKTFTVAKLLARGWVETTDENVFPREYWKKVESPVEGADRGHKEIVKGNSIPVIEPESEMVEESELLPEAVVTVETLADAQDVEELTEDEEKERHRLELKVERAFYEAGSALREIRARRLYRVTHPNDFIGYCRARFGKTKQAVNYLIAAADVFENLTTTTNSCRILPTSETQVRDIAGFPAQKQVEIWNEAIEASGGKVAPRRVVKGIVERLKEKPLTLASDFCSIGDVFTLSRLEGVERKYNGCWAIASELRDFTIAVDVHDATLTVKPDNLQPIDSPDARRQLPEILKRIRRLRECDLLDRCAYTVLESLGRQTYLTDFEADLLTFMEQRYGIEN